MKPPPARPLTEPPAERIEVALLHFEQGLRRFAAGRLPRDEWEAVAEHMDRSLAAPAADRLRGDDACWERIQVARLHFEITRRTDDAGLPVDWGYSCYRMAGALLDAGDDPDALGEPIDLGEATRHVLRHRRGAGA